MPTDLFFNELSFTSTTVTPATPSPPPASSMRLTDDLLMDAEDSKGRIILSTWDFGGQEIFYTIHHLFLTQFGVYLVVFSMTDMLNSTKKKKCIEYLRFWLNSISLHALGAPVFLIGTFKDKVNKPEQHAGIAAELISVFGAVPCFKYVVGRADPLCFFPVDNTTLHDPVFSLLRHSIETCVAGNALVKEEVPLPWLALFDQLREIGKVKPVLSFEDVVKLARMPSGEVETALLYFHNLGYVVFYNDPSLRHLVVLEPQWIVDHIAAIIRDHQPRQEDGKILHPYEAATEKRIQLSKSEWPMLWENFTKNGKLSVRLLDALWPAGFDHATLLILLTRFGLVVPFDPLPDTTYLVPSLLPLKPLLNGFVESCVTTVFVFDLDERVIKEYNTTPSIIRIANLSRSFLPNGLFERLLCQLQAWEQCRSIITTVFSKNWVTGVLGFFFFFSLFDYIVPIV